MEIAIGILVAVTIYAAFGLINLIVLSYCMDKLKGTQVSKVRVDTWPGAIIAVCTGTIVALALLL